MTRDNVRVIVPVKDLDRAKRRLSRVLGASERQQLVLAMLADVLTATDAARLENVGVLSPDRRVLAFAETHGARPLAEHSAAGSLNAALRYELQDEEREAALVLLADTPLTMGNELAALVSQLEASQAGPDASVTLSPDRTRGGTNAMLLRPPTAIRPRFGPNSLSLHMREAERTRISCRILHMPGLALDLDTPADLARFLAEGRSGTRTHRFLAEIHFAERLRAVATQTQP